MSHEEIEMNLQQIRSSWKDRLCSARVLFVTFGTSWGYERRDLREIVANCHRYPQDSFVKRMSTVAEIVHPWKEAITMLKELNAQIQIVFTVSPVRHSRDGLIENNRSKATLHLAVEELTNVKDVYYFPSYEIVIDELRDHRYFAEDLVHPNAQAVNFVWERLADRFFDRETRVIAEKVFSLKRSLSHKIMYPESAETERFKKQLENELISFKDMNPDIVW